MLSSIDLILLSASACFLRSISITLAGALLTKLSLLSFFCTEARKKHVVAASPVVMACPDSYVETDNSPDSAYFSYPILGVENPRHFYACYRKDMYLTKYMKGFLEILHEI